MTRQRRKQPTKLDIKDSLAQLAIKKPNAAENWRADLLESIRHSCRILAGSRDTWTRFTPPTPA